MSLVRKHFTSRFGDNGRVCELDFSQLETIVLAHLSQDPQLLHDIRNGVDLHRVNAANIYSIPAHEVTAKQRQNAKQCSFQLSYGSGYKNMAKKCNVSEKLAKKFIEEYYLRYPGVKAWQESIAAEVRKNRQDSGDKTPKGFPKGVSKLPSQTGRVYTFFERDAAGWVKRDTDFYSTEMKNYPIQGFAAEIVAVVLGKVFRAVRAQGPLFQSHVKMINTVHDSIVFDVQEDWVSYCYDLVHPIMENVPAYLKQHFDIDFDLPLKVEMKTGKSWLDMENYAT